MEAITERCCGLDVHQATVVACLLVGVADRRPRKEVRTFGATTKELLALRDWLVEAGCTHVAMESTGVYWKPVYAVLEGAFELIVGNARHIRNVPGRKTDVKDAEWIADLQRHGLIAKSFVPPPPIRVLRDLVRYRRKLVQARSSERNRLLKLLETVNVKLSSVLSDVFGVSGMAMLRELVNGRLSPEEMSMLARGQLRQKRPQIVDALEGRFDDDHRFVLQMQLDRLDENDAQLARLDERIDARLTPYREKADQLTQLPGIGRTLAGHLIAELGTDMTVFKSAKHLASWAGVCPGNHESAGKQKRGTTRKGNVHLTVTLVEAAQSAVKTRGSYLRDKFHRLRARRGYKRAIFAIAHKLLISAYQVISGATYKDLGETYLDRLDQRRTTKSLVKRLERLGYSVTLQEVTHA